MNMQILGACSKYKFQGPTSGDPDLIDLGQVQETAW